MFKGLDFVTPVLALAVYALGLTVGWTFSGYRWEAKYAALEKAHAEEMAARNQAVLDAIGQVRELEKHGDSIAARVIEAEAARNQLAKERDDAIRKQATGRPCLGAGLVGLLNGPASPGLGFRLPQASSGLVDPDTAITADTAYASDTDIALWAANARDAHDACRARIGALREFYQLEGQP